MRQLKIILTISITLAFTSVWAQHNAIFNGGNDEGYATGQFDSPENNSIFSGSGNDGYHAARSATPTGNNVFNGGINDGYGTRRFSTLGNNSIFSGGINDGYARSGLPMATSNGIFTGGLNDGYARSKAETESNNGIYTGGINDGYATERSSEIVVDASLPIELLYFDAFRDGADVLTQWETITEQNNDYFTVEKTKDSRTILDVGTLPSQGNGSGDQYYELLDVDPFPGTSYYRLRQTDFDGTESWSDWVAVKFPEVEGTDTEMVIQPNPVTGDQFDVVLTGVAEFETVDIQVYNMNGILTFSVSANINGKNSLRKTLIPTIDLPAGMYVVVVSGNGLKMSRKLLVVR